MSCVPPSLPSVLFLCIGPYLPIFDFLRAQRLNRGCRSVLRSASLTRLIVEREGLLLLPCQESPFTSPDAQQPPLHSLAGHLQRVMQLLVVVQQRILRGAPPPSLLRQLWFSLLLPSGADAGEVHHSASLRPQLLCPAASLSTKEAVRRGRYDVGVVDGGEEVRVALLLDDNSATTCWMQPMQIEWPTISLNNDRTYATRRSGRELMAARWGAVHWIMGVDDTACRAAEGDDSEKGRLDAFPRLVGLYLGCLQLTSDRWNRPMLEEPREGRRKEGGSPDWEQLMVIEWRAQQGCAFAYCCLLCFCTLELDALTKPWLGAFTQQRQQRESAHRPKPMFIDSKLGEHFRKGLYVHWR